MEDKINKLIIEYETKVSQCDKEIETLEVYKKRYRREGNELGFDETKKELAIKYAQRQAYFQAKVDIDALLD